MILNSLAFLFGEAMMNIRRNGLMSIAALGTVTVALTVLGGSTWTAYRVTEVAQSQPHKFNVIEAFLHDDSPRAQTMQVKQRIESDPDVSAVHLVSKEHAWAVLQTREPSLTQALPNNPLMDRLDIEARSGARVNQVATRLRNSNVYPEIQQVNDAHEEVQSLLGFARILKVLGLGTAIGLFVGTLFIVQNTIRLTVLARRREIRIMQLVGATSGFIRLPFVLEGVFHGLVGGVLASGILVVCAREVSRFVHTLHSPMIGDAPSSLTEVNVILTLVAVGVLTGMMGSTLSLRRFLHQP